MIPSRIIVDISLAPDSADLTQSELELLESDLTHAVEDAGLRIENVAFEEAI